MTATDILMVDDDQDICTRWRTSCPGTLEVFVPQRYRLALLDYKMPGMDGLELCRRLKGSQPDVEVVLVTAYASTTDAAAEAGIRRILPKPVDCEELISLIEETVGKP